MLINTRKPKKTHNNYDIMSHKTVAAETITIKPADNVSSI